MFYILFIIIMTTTLDASAERKIKIYVPLFKTEYNGMISYQPKSKSSNYEKWYPVGIWTNKQIWENDYWPEFEYDNKFRVSLSANEKKEEWKWDVIITLKNVDDADNQYTIYLYRDIRDDWSVSFVSKKDWRNYPKKVCWVKYFIALYWNNNQEKKNDMMLIFTEASQNSSDWFNSFWSKKEISFNANNSNNANNKDDDLLF